jgi:hypothetical protein
MKDILAPLIEDYDGTYDKELDSDPIRDNYSLADEAIVFEQKVLLETDLELTDPPSVGHKPHVYYY